ETGKKLYLKRKAVLIDYARQYQQAHETLKRQGISTPNIYDLWKTSDEEGQRWYYDYTNSIMTAIGGY
ncbi:MAG TPA: hypothetical protein VLG71_01470, partial [Candidatus Limnocylindria bacterium]|nr:hypothetical protein [Candidatus Limnocylindria bacterium]